MESRRGFAIKRLMNAMTKAHADGWFIVFDTLTLADDRLEAFYDNPNALRDYFRDIGRMVLAAEGRKANDSHADCYQYFCVPEYGTANGRLHFHADRKSGSAGMTRPISYAVFCLKKKKKKFQKIDGVAYLGPILAGLREPRLSGFRIIFAYVDNHGVRRDFTGRVSGSTMEGSFRTDGGAEGHWTAARKQG